MKNNYIRVLKMTAFYSLLGLLLQGFLVSILFASTPSEGQDLRSIKVTLNVQNVTLEDAILTLEKNSNMKFVYLKEEVALDEIVTIDVTNESLYDLLKGLAGQYGLVFQRINNQIVIKKSSAADVIETQPLPEVGAIKGRVTDAKTGEPLVGANIVLKGTTKGVTTDSKGYYEFENLTADSYTIVVKYVGYATREEDVSLPPNRTLEVNLILTPSLVNLDEITVTGTLSAREKRAVATTITEIKGSELQNRNLTNIANVLEAVPGIILQHGAEGDNVGNSRQPYGLLIRGTSGLGSNIKYLIDGIEVVSFSYSAQKVNILQTMDPNDIEKIEVLKGPMASTLYGNGAGGGVIAITTKKGKEGKTRINFKTMFTQYANDFADYNGYSQDYSLNIMGGGDQFSYLLGVGYNIYPTTKLTDINNGIDDKTWSYTAKINGKINNISADLSLQYGNENKGAGLTTISENKFRQSLGLSQLTVGTLNDYRYSQRSFSTTLHLTQMIEENWYHDLTIGYNLTNFSQLSYTASRSGTYSNSEYLFSKVNARYFMFFDHSWSKEIKSGITAGLEYVNYDVHTLNLSSAEPVTDFLPANTPATASSATFTKAPYLSTGYFTEVVTGFNNKLFLTTGIRFDINNAYGDNIDAYAQPRAGLSYVVNFGDFNIKPRAVWGVSSDAPDPTYKTTHTIAFSFGNFVYLGNPDIKPQRSEGFEFGADFYYGNNYSLNVTYYDQRIKDMIQSSYTLDLTTSPRTYYYLYTNIAEVINRGLEVSAKAIIEPFTLDLSFTETTSKWGDEIGQTPTTTIYPGASLSNVPKRSFYARLTYSIPSLLSWMEKGGRVSLDWRFNGSAFTYDDISYYLDYDAWQKLPTPRPPAPSSSNYLIWVKGYSYFNLRMDYSVTDYAALYVDIQNLFDKQGSSNGQIYKQFPGRRINFGFNITY